MADDIRKLAGRSAVVLDERGPIFDAAVLAQNLIGLAWQYEADLVVVPASRLPGSFFELRSGVIGTVAQKCVNYHVQLAVIGDTQKWSDTSKAFRDFVYETNKGAALWFLADIAALEAKLA